MWCLRVYAGRRPSGTPIQVAKTSVTPEAAKGTAKPGDGIRLADRELAKMVSDVSEGRLGRRDTTLGDLIDQWIASIEDSRSPTTIREYRPLVEKVVKPELGSVMLSKSP